MNQFDQHLQNQLLLARQERNELAEMLLFYMMQLEIMTQPGFSNEAAVRQIAARRLIEKSLPETRKRVYKIVPEICDRLDRTSV